MIRELFKDYGIDARERGSEHCRPGWVQICCPMCPDGDGGFHMGYNFDKQYGFTCYRCGHHFPDQVIARLLQITRAEAGRLYRRYVKTATITAPEAPNSDIEAPGRALVMPGGYRLENSNSPAYGYLRARFPHISHGEFSGMIRRHSIYYTGGNAGAMRNRIIFPAFWSGRIVTFQGRDYTGRASATYMNPNPDKELLNIKEIAWGLDFVPGDRVLVCEGVMDALAVGAGAVHLGGLGYTRRQVEILRQFRNVYICFDSEPGALRIARKLASDLGLGVQAAVVHIDAPDIAECGKDELKRLRQLINQ